MPKKSTRNVKESRIDKKLDGSKPSSADGIVKHFRSIHINVKTAKRWFFIKKRLSLVTDDEFAAYLLDLAEPIVRRDGKCTSPNDWKTDQDKENDLEVIKVDDKELIVSEEPLRRSPRKQCIPVALDAVSPSADLTQSVQSTEKEILENVFDSHERRRSRVKHHRTKAKHHKDKKSKRKHSKNNDEKSCITSNGERSILSRVDGDKHGSSTVLKNHQICVISGPKKQDQRFSGDENTAISDTEVDRTLLEDNFNKTEKETENLATEEIGSYCNEKDNGTESLDNESEKLDSNYVFETSTEVANSDYNIVDNVEEDEFQDTFDEKDKNVVAGEERHDENEEILPVVPQKKKIIDEKKVKKKRKHPKQDNATADNQDCASSGKESVHKRHKRKHKHAADYKAKKYHDVRKAPQDGKIIASEIVEDDVIARNPIVTNASIGQQPETDVEGAVTEPQRLAIKIKLCQDCNDRHIEDACPLISTEYVIPDSLTYEEWSNKHKNNPDVSKALASVDPMSEGYTISADDACESEEESVPGEQLKNRIKVESEDKQLNVNTDRPLYARDSLPDCFELKTNTEHGVGIYARNSLPMYTKLGPLVGNPIKEMDIPDDFSMRHIWEIDDDGKTAYISTTNPLKSNWIRYMRPADTKEERTVAVITKHGELHLVTTQNITAGMELTYWADSQSSTWTRKNKIDKTNCGGCNLNFAHPIYYRLHCCIFHDTNYSLTIRKYHCKVCGAAVLGKDNIMKHAAELHGGRGAYQCQYCRKFFLRLNYLEMHRTYGCSQNPQRSRPLCDFCGRKFCQPQKLKVHIKRMHSDMSEVLREFQCKLCLKLLGSRAALQRHMKEVHHKAVVGAATCDRCGKMFQNKSNLKIHMLTHSGVKPFKCKENDCKAAFTTKQCLQFHYKKVHGLSEDMMPKIERSVAYTFDAYSGGLVEDVGRGKTPKSGRRGSQQENSNSLLSLDDCSSEHSSRAEVSMSSFNATINEFEGVSTLRRNSDHDIQEPPPTPPPLPHHHEVQAPSAGEVSLENVRPAQEVDFYGTSRLQSKGSKKWMGEFNPPNEADIVGQQQQHQQQQQEQHHQQQQQEQHHQQQQQEQHHQQQQQEQHHQQQQQEQHHQQQQQEQHHQQQQQQQQQHSAVSARVDVYEFEETNKKDESRNDSVSVNQNLINDSKLGLNIYRRTESTNASLLVEAALDAAERDIGAVSSPILDDNDRDGNLYSISSQLQSPLPSRSSESHLDSYIQQQEDLMSPSATPDDRKTPPTHVQIDYHLHRPVEYINSPRTHSIEQYLPQDDLPRVSSPGGYIHVQQEDLASPSATPNSRYQEIHHHHHHHHHQVPTDNLSSDEGDSVAQNLSLSVKEKSLQLDLSTSYKYDPLDTEFGRERTNFEPLVLNSGEMQGLDMSARGFHHGLGTQIQNTRYHHHLYEITERQSVDLSRTSGYSMSPPPPYPHSEVLRIVSLDLTPGHSVDLSLSRSHHLHGTGARVITSPQPPGSSTPHVVPDTVDGRILSPPPPSIPGYNATYPVSPAPYHPPRPGYHHYTGYY